jgi:phosphonate transport system ATP-binding protein
LGDKLAKFNSGDPIFHLQSVTCQFGQVLALKDCNLSIYGGERVALIGPSGAGKSTLLSLLNGSLVPSTGEVLLLGHNPQKIRPVALRRLQRSIGTVYQQQHLVGNLSVIHNVNAGHLGRLSLAKSLWSLVWPQEVESAARALEQVGILEKLYARTDRLSGGQQQRVALARVLVQDPLAILADEPISSVDPERSREMMELLLHLNETSGKTLVISLHDVKFAVRYCDRIIGLRHGQILFDTLTPSVTRKMLTELYRL